MILVYVKHNGEYHYWTFFFYGFFTVFVLQSRFKYPSECPRGARLFNFLVTCREEEGRSDALRRTATFPAPRLNFLRLFSDAQLFQILPRVFRCMQSCRSTFAKSCKKPKTVWQFCSRPNNMCLCFSFTIWIVPFDDYRSRPRIATRITTADVLRTRRKSRVYTLF